MSFTAPELSLFVRDFSAGYLDTPEADALPPGATPDAQNAMFSRIGEDPLRVTIKKRDGHRLINPTAMFAIGTRVDGMAEYRRVGASQVLLAGSGGRLHDYDNANGFNNIIVGFTAGNPMRFAFHRGQAIAMDGTFMRRVNTSLQAFPVGFIAPTTAPALAVAAGPGVTGTYEGFAVWYDSATDHESSPSPISAAVAFANQSRSWTKPGGAPPANVTHWRVYVRRTDTNEANYFRAGTFTVATNPGVENTSDAARVNIGPRPGDNDPPPGNFAFMGTFRGYAIGVLPNDSTFYVSKVNDFESWNPNNAFKVANGRAELRVAKSFGTQFLIQTPVGSFTLEGDQVPFRIVEAHTDFGCVTQDACGEVSYQGGNRFYGWDEAKGPYWWDGQQTWVALANNRIQGALSRITKSEQNRIRFAHDTTRHLVMWCVPINTSSRARYILAFDYTLDRWLPPMNGLEVGALCEFTNPSSGEQAVFLGDLWGRVYEMFGQVSDGNPTGSDTYAEVASATASTVTAVPGTAFYTAGNGLAGLLVAVSAPSGAWQWRRIQSNTATVITLDTTNDAPWDTIPMAGWDICIGAIEFYWTTPWIDFGRPDRWKRLSYFIMGGRTETPGSRVEIYARFNDESGTSGWATSTFETAGATSLWGTAIWGESLWGVSPRQVKKTRANRSCLTVQLRFQNYYAEQGVDITLYGIEADWLQRRRALGMG